MNPFAEEVTTDTSVRPDSNPRGISPYAKFNSYSEEATTYLTLAEVFTYMKISVPLVGFIIYFLRLYMVPMGPALSDLKHKLVGDASLNLISSVLFYPVGILISFFLMALPFDILIIYTSYRTPQEAKAIAKNSTYYFLSQLSLFLVLVNTLVAVLAAAWGFYYLSLMELGLIEIFMQTFAISCLASQFLQIGSAYSFY